MLRFAMAICFFWAGSALAVESAGPQNIVELIFSKAGKTLVTSDKKLQNEINEQIDFSEMAKDVLGKEFKNRSALERSWFQETLKEIITRTVYPEAPKFLKRVKIQYKKVKEYGKRATVNSIVLRRGEETEVDYALRRIGERWKVVDVAIDGESWVDNISEQVHRTIRKRKWAGLKSRLGRRLASLRADGKKAKNIEHEDESAAR